MKETNKLTLKEQNKIYKEKIIEFSKQLDAQQDYKEIKEENKKMKLMIANLSHELDVTKNWNKRFTQQIQLKTEILKKLEDLIEDRENRWQMIKDYAKHIYEIDIYDEIEDED